MERICGGCRFFRPTGERDDGRIGQCRLQKVIGVFREAMRACPSYAGPGEVPTVGAGSRRQSGGARRRAGGEAHPLASNAVSAERLAAALAELSAPDLKAALSGVLRQQHLLCDEELGRAWSGGMLVLQPAADDLKPKELALEQLLHKLVMIRDNLRVLEQKLNSNTLLQDAERIDLQRRVSLAHVAVHRMATGWLPVTTESPAVDLLRRLVVEAEGDSLSLPVPPLGDRWHGGQVVITAGDERVVEPIEPFYRRLALVRDRLSALSALLAAHPHLGESDADQMGGYIRRCYGSLTSFNVLFRDRADYFSSGR